MDYYHSQTIQSPPIKKFSKLLIQSHSSKETAKSVVPEKKIISNVHWFCALHENEDDLQTRKILPIPSMPNLPVVQNEEIVENNKTNTEKNQQNVKITPKNNKRNPNNKKYRNSNFNQSKEMYAGGGYAKSPDPKELSKPKIMSPQKKRKKDKCK